MKRSRQRWWFIGLGLVALLLAGCVGGGMETASLKGEILDPNGEPFLGTVVVEIDERKSLLSHLGSISFQTFELGREKDLKASSEGYFSVKEWTFRRGKYKEYSTFVQPRFRSSVR